MASYTSIYYPSWTQQTSASISKNLSSTLVNLLPRRRVSHHNHTMWRRPCMYVRSYQQVAHIKVRVNLLEKQRHTGTTQSPLITRPPQLHSCQETNWGVHYCCKKVHNHPIPNYQRYPESNLESSESTTSEISGANITKKSSTTYQVPTYLWSANLSPCTCQIQQSLTVLSVLFHHTNQLSYN